MLGNEIKKSSWCEINRAGRILLASRRFCKMFGFSDEEIAWHYFCDLCRYQKDWENLKSARTEPKGSGGFIARLKNRRGRSFWCKIFRTAVDASDSSVYRLEFERVHDEQGSKEEDSLSNAPFFSSTDMARLAV